MAELNDRRSARLCDRCRPGDRRGGAGGARRRTRRGWRARPSRSSSCRCRRDCQRGTFVAPAALRDRRARRCSSARCSARSCTSSAIAGDRLDEVMRRDQRHRLRPDARPPQPHRQRRVDEVESRVRVGNIYVNRNQIGAVVGAQPFGGEGLSGTGPKAGRPALSATLRHRAGAVDRHHRLGRQCRVDVDGGRWRPLACQLSNSLRIIFSARLRVLIYIPVVIFEVDVDGG